MKKHFFMIATLIAVALAGCTRNNSVATEEHAHEENLQLTAYSADFEVYAEASPFGAGQQSDILAHFSFLKNFKPITEGKITVSLITGTDGVRQTLEQPTRTGIYGFQLTPTTAGAGKILFDIETPAGSSQIVVPNITVYADVHDAQHAAANAVATSTSGAIFTKEQSWKVDFATDEVHQEPFGQVIRTTAQIQPSQGDERIIVAKTSGAVVFTSNVTEGKNVDAGQTLFYIDGSANADNNLAVRQAEAKSNYDRLCCNGAMDMINHSPVSIYNYTTL